jgi:hypothetical protein
MIDMIKKESQPTVTFDASKKEQIEYDKGKTIAPIKKDEEHAPVLKQQNSIKDSPSDLYEDRKTPESVSFMQ